MNDQERINALKKALKRVVRVMEWCPLCDLHNVGSDMRKAKEEISSVICSYPAKQGDKT